ncbi:hypothetical protein Emed_007605 [Eimeria media]
MGPAPRSEMAASGNASCAGSQNHVTPGALAWMPCKEQGFVTVKVLAVDPSTKSARVEVHPEGAACVAAAQAAASVLRQAAQAEALQDQLPAVAAAAPSEQDVSTEQTASPSQLEKKKKHKKPATEESPWMLGPPAAPTAAFTDPFSSRNGLRLEDSSEESESEEPEQSSDDASASQADCGSSLAVPSGAQTPRRSSCSDIASSVQREATAAAAAADAAAAVTAAFAAQPPKNVPLAHLWPYVPPPMPPHPVPDDSASCGSLSAAALLQQLQHRYLRNEIYTYAAHVLLAVNPYKPLPQLYSTQQILLYRHWKEVARAYRRSLNAEEADPTGLANASGRSTDAKDAVQSVINRLPGILPVTSVPGNSCDTNANSVAAEDGGEPLNPWTRINSLENTTFVGAAEAAAAAAAEQAFKESTVRVNRPPPHPFAIAEEALRRLVGSQTNQTIVVSGQSGAGKTETSKQLMLFLTHVSTAPDKAQGLSSSDSTGSPLDAAEPLNVSEQRRRLAAATGGMQTLREAAELRKRIVSCNAIFESFGNAATRRNHNSSRIGRLTMLHFDSGGLLRGGSLRTYLLEAARLTAHKRGDRNFHVFYQLLRGATDEECSSLGLVRHSGAYRMLQPQDSDKFLQKVFSREQQQDTPQSPGQGETSGEDQIPLDVDQENFAAMVEALKRAEFSLTEVEELLELLAGLLHLSNISFVEGQSGPLELQDEASQDALARAASLLGLNKEELKELLRCRRMRLKGDTVHTQRNQQQSFSACCSIIKFIYSRLFDYIVQRLNESAARQMRQRQQVNLGLNSQDGENAHNTIGNSTKLYRLGSPGSKEVKAKNDLLNNSIAHCQQAFTGICGRITESHQVTASCAAVLDIYGFECFGLENGLEQLCINYANEKQQQLFVQRVIEEEIALYTREGIANPAVTAAQRRQKQHGDKDEAHHSTKDKDLHETFKASLEKSLFSSLPDTSVLLRDLQEGVFRRLDDSCRLLAQGQQRDDLHFWKDLFAYCVSSKQDSEVGKRITSQQPQQQMSGAEQYLLFCLKGIQAVKAADAAANGQLLQHLQQEDLSSIGLVAAEQLAVQGLKGPSAASAAGKAAAGKVQERVFAVKHFAGTVLYGTDGWLELNNDRIEYELERLVASSGKPLLRQAMEQHEARQQLEGLSVTAAGGGQFSSITKRFVKSVKDLSQELQGPHMQLHFIRCFIPNRYMRPDNFERKIVLQQLQHSGTLALVDILHVGFPHRMPLRSVAARLRQSLEPLLQLRLQEQEQIVEHLRASRNHLHPTDPSAAMLNEELKEQHHMLQTLRHCHPANVRDRTLVSATLGLLPQCRPGAFICGVSMICFKAAAYGEASELMTDPSQFFQTPKDVCRLVIAIQRLRWRVATRILLHVHPTLLWLHRRALLMRRIKEETVKIAVRMLLLKKLILFPLKERVKRRLVLRQGLRILEHMLMRRGFRALRRHRAAAAAAEAASLLANAERAKEATATKLKKCPPPLDLSAVRTEAKMPEAEEELPPCQGNHPWNALFFPLNSQGQTTDPLQQDMVLHVGKGLYLLKIKELASSDEDQPVSEQRQDQPTLQIQAEPVAICSAQQPSTGPQLAPSMDNHGHVGDNLGLTPRDTSGHSSPHIVSVAMHPSYSNLFLVCNSAAQLVLLDFCGSSDPVSKEEGAREKHLDCPMRSPPTPSGEPSTSLPLLQSPSAYRAEESAQQTPRSSHTATPRRGKGRLASPLCLEQPSLPDYLEHCKPREDKTFPSKFLSKTPIPPSKWLPRDLLHLVAGKAAHRDRHSEAPSSRPPTVRPLRVSFAHPTTADYALVLCLVQGANDNSDGATAGQLAIVLVDLITKRTAGWLPLNFSANGLSACARRHSVYLQRLITLSSPEASGSRAGSDQASVAAATPAEQGPRLNARSRSIALSTIQMKPLWGNTWIVAGPALLALFSVNLRFLQHPPESINGENADHEPPLRLLWNLTSVPRLEGMSLTIADAWFTACTYTRVAARSLSSASGAGALAQFLQQMPYGRVARSLEARMQRLLLLSTAENKVLLMQYSEKRSCVPTAAGNLVLVDQVQLTHPILQFFRQVPGEEEHGPLAAAASPERHARLCRAFPWEADSLMPPLQSKNGTGLQRADSDDCVDSDGGRSNGSDDEVKCNGEVQKDNHKLAAVKTTNRQGGTLSEDFPSYGLGMVERSSGRIIHSLDKEAWQDNEGDGKKNQGHLLAMTPLPSHPGHVASLWTTTHGALRLRLGNEQGEWKAFGDLDIQKDNASQK